MPKLIHKLISFSSIISARSAFLSIDTIDISGASAGEDFAVTTDSSIQLVQTEAVTDGINIDATGGVDIDSALTVAIDTSGAGSDFDVDAVSGSVWLDGGETDSQAIWLAATATASGIDMDAGTDGIDADTTGPIVLTSTANTAAAVVIQSTLGGIDIQCDASDGEAIDISNADGPINITSTHDQVASINIATSNAAGQIQITSTDTSDDGIEIDSAGGIEIDASNGTNNDGGYEFTGKGILISFQTAV